MSNVDVLRLICCPTYSIEIYQHQLNEKILRRRQSVYGPAEGRLLLIIVENFLTDSCMASFVLQLVRHSTYYKDLDEVQLEDFTVTLQ